MFDVFESGILLSFRFLSEYFLSSFDVKFKSFTEIFR